MESKRRLAAIMFTDIVGYTSLSQRDETLALRLLEEHRNLLRTMFPRYNGIEIKTIGDSFLVEFASALEATRCALDIQRKLHEGNLVISSENQISIRIGVHLGDVVHTADGDVQGDAVNVASRIEPLAGPGGICVSDQVYYLIKNKIEYPIVEIGHQQLKNVQEPMSVYRVVLPWIEPELHAHGAPSYRNRLVVLPFKSMSPDPNDEYFADGIMEELITALSGIAGLDVIARTTAMHYKGGSKRASVIGEELDCKSLIEGSVRKAGNRVRISVQLVRAHDESHVWAQNYNKRLDDIFAVQSDIAKRVARTLKVRLLDGKELGKRTAPNIETYTLYLRGMYLWNKMSMDANLDAMECFKRAVEIDPSFAPGYCGLARCHILNADFSWKDRASAFKNARTFTLKALELDAKLAEAHMWHGRILWRNDYKQRRAEEEFRKAIELKPSFAEAHMYLGHLLFFQQRSDEAYKEITKTADLDPLSIFATVALGAYFAAVRDHDKATEHFKKGLEMAPNNALLRLLLFRSYCLSHKYNEALSEFKQASASVSLPQDQTKPFLLLAYTYLGKMQEVRTLLSSSDGQIDQDLRQQPFMVAIAYALLSEIDAAFEWLEKAVDQADPLVTMFLTTGEELDGVRSDPRYRALLERVNLE